MIVDFNAYVGYWPFRRLPARSADEVVNLLDKTGIDMAVVSSLNSTLYTDVHEGNLELMEEIRHHRERLIPVAVLNPKYPGWEDDLEECVRIGFKGIRLYPQYHNYMLTDDECLRFISKVSEMNLVVSIPVRLRDRRGRHWMDAARDMDFAEVEQLASKSPDSRIVLLESRGAENSMLIKYENIYFETSRISTTLGELTKLFELVGASRLVFGSGVPLKYISPAKLRVQLLDVQEDVKEKMLWRNAFSLLGLDVDTP